MKIKGHIAFLLAFILLVGMIISPVSAQDVIYTAPEGQALQAVNIYSDSGTDGTIILTQQNGDVTTGSWSYGNVVWGLPPSYAASVTLAANTSSTTFVTPGQLIISVTATNNALNTYGPAIEMGIGQTKFLSNEIVTTPIKAYPITSFEVTSTKDVTVVTRWVPLVDASHNLKAQNADWIAAIMDLAYLIFWDAIPFITSLAYWIRYFFVANLPMVIALFLAVPMAFAAKNSKGNPEKFFRQYFATLKGLFLFIILLWHTLLDSIGTVRGWFRL